MEIAAIGAMARNRVIGSSQAEKGIPWDCPEDMKRFRELTRGHIVAMGRKTFQLCGPLPGRLNWVLTRSNEIVNTESLQGFHSPYEMLNRYHQMAAQGDPRILWVIGGANIWQELFPFCHRLEMTVLNQDAEGDTVMPSFEDLGWTTVTPVQGETCTFITYRR